VWALFKTCKKYVFTLAYITGNINKNGLKNEVFVKFPLASLFLGNTCLGFRYIIYMAYFIFPHYLGV